MIITTETVIIVNPQGVAVIQEQVTICFTDPQLFLEFLLSQLFCR